MRHIDVYIRHDVKVMSRSENANYIYVMVYKQHEKEETGMVQDVTQNGVVLEAIIDSMGHMSKSETLDITVFTNNMYISGMYSNGTVKKWIENGYMSAKGHPIADADRWKKMVDISERHKLHIIYSPQNDYSDKLDNRLSDWKKERLRFNT